jgi:HAD superfamily hydrolase (TIGR01509 family)
MNTILTQRLEVQMSRFPELVIFDMDGVLVDACGWHLEAFNAALKHVCNYEIPLEEHYKIYNGLPTKIKLKMLVEANKIEKDNVQDIFDFKQERTLEIIRAQSEERPEKVELIQWLKSNNARIACFTNSIRETASLVLAEAGILEHLEYFLTNEDVINAKPDPEGYIQVLKHFNCVPKNAMIIEDSPKGEKAARASGCSVMKVTNATEVIKKGVKRFIDESFNTHGG